MIGRPAGHGAPAPKVDRAEREKIRDYIRIFSWCLMDARRICEIIEPIIAELKSEYQRKYITPDVPDPPALLERENIEEAIAAYLRGTKGKTAAEIKTALGLDADGETVLYVSDQFLLGGDNRWHYINGKTLDINEFNKFPGKDDDDE